MEWSSKHTNSILMLFNYAFLPLAENYVVHAYTYMFVPYISGNSKAPGVGTLPMFCIEKPFCACTAQRNLRIAWRLQNRIFLSVKIKLQAITSGNDNRTSLTWLSIVQPPGQLITFQHLDPRRCRYKSAVS